MKHITVRQGKDELISTSGNHFCGLLIRKLSQSTLPKDFTTKRAGAIADRDILMTQIGLLSNARTDFNDVDLYRDDRLFTHAFGIQRLPSESILRQRLDEMPPQQCHSSLRALNLDFLKTRSLGRIDAGGFPLVPVDVDVSPLDNSGSKKAGVSYTYKGHDGYAPIFAYIGSEGYMLDTELRPGKQHCQAGTPAFLHQLSADIKTLGLNGHILYRLDSGNDAWENFAELSKERYIVKRNPRKESPEQWFALARRVGTLQESRPGNRVYRGIVSHLRPGKGNGGSEVPVVFEVTERLTDPDGNLLLIPELEISTYWTNLPCDADTVIALYHDHGTSEQFHSELKSDLDVERLPSGKFCVNQIVLLCAMVSFNLLRGLGQEAIQRAEAAPVRIRVRRWRIKTVLQNLVYCAGKLVSHAGRLELHLGRICPWYAVLRDIAASYG
ncbi:MAG: IS1380 family transposase [Verrucomicrobia bacterium]|nr:IS1380 family transposase [Verrucomicrobiota bacterium]